MHNILILSEVNDYVWRKRVTSLSLLVVINKKTRTRLSIYKAKETSYIVLCPVITKLFRFNFMRLFKALTSLYGFFCVLMFFNASC